ncbi:hypothetical protein GE09DRAFT_395123 [Coniochaeta sp. 2T2.1]|nr:hypothetical protein GE09DRAFT_395123 [Coniochaeta sp. 2T2.1]
MSGQRPEFLDLRSQSQASVSRPLRSPRLHVAGEVPPEYSPLDAFAMQSRALARQLKEETKAGKRMSRLPPLTTDSPLIVQGRSDYFRSMSAESGSDHSDSPAPHSAQSGGLGQKADIEDVAIRPMSMHPRMSRVPPTPEEPLPLASTRGQLETLDERNSYFGAPRAQSPPGFETTTTPPAQEELRPVSRSATHDSTTSNYSNHSNHSNHSQRSPVRGFAQTNSPEKIVRMDSFDASGLAPPRTLFPKRSSSILSSPLVGADEEGSTSLSASFHSQPARKLSSTSSTGMMSPAFPPYQRSPSVCSDASALPRPSFNFSRPLSRAGTPGFDMPERQASSDSHASFILTDDTANTPVSMTGDGFPDTLSNDPNSQAPTYTYSTFKLPRGKSLQRESREDNMDLPQQMAQQLQQPSYSQIPGGPPPSPPSRPASAAGPPRFLEEPVPRPSLERSKLSTEVLRGGQEISPVLSRPSTEVSRISTNTSSRFSEDTPRGRPRMAPLHGETPRGRTAMSTTTSDSASTIKPTRSLPQTNNTEMSPEDHVTKAIALHEQGILNESTYHLRRAAKQGNPTGMLLYALACRHGWGMRPNQQEGVQWLRKAAESASVEMAEEEEQAKEGKPVDIAEKKTRKAQFALSIYELGVSHMNGWGIEQDKALALRCFEIAGSWGDVDALAEAGFCYAQGVGCRKNLKKSAAFYRQAEAKGMSMVGNSWIHKSKYNEKEKEKDDKADKKRSKSKPRKSMFFKSSS